MKPQHDPRPSLRLRDFLDEDEIKRLVNPQGARRALLIFRTSVQQTWLVATADLLYCVLDDIRKALKGPSWFIPISDILNDGDIENYITAKERHGNRTQATHGLVDIGPNHNNWLYTKSLFRGTTIANRIGELIAG